MLNPALWQKLERLSFDDPEAVSPFSKKLEDQEDWRESHTAKVIEEYRKFLYLSQVVPGGVVPSEDVDKAWHLHLTYTRDYWDHLCGEIFGKPLHHEPSRGPRDEAALMSRYGRTLEVYREEFGRPPAAVWPSVRRLRARATGRRMTGIGGAAFAVGFLALFVTTMDVVRLDFGTLPWFLAFGGLAVMFTGMWIAGDLHFKSKSNGDGGGCGSSCGGD